MNKKALGDTSRKLYKIFNFFQIIRHNVLLLIVKMIDSLLVKIINIIFDFRPIDITVQIYKSR